MVLVVPAVPTHWVAKLGKLMAPPGILMGVVVDTCATLGSVKVVSDVTKAVTAVLRKADVMAKQFLSGTESKRM